MSEQEKSLVEESKDEKKVRKEKAKKKKQSKVKKWFRELKAEVKKIVWPAKDHVKNNTIVVLVTVLIAMLAIAGLDLIFQFISDALIALG
ncbi:MAG: preprotein translocase subunit SecE [Clostridia bacterium]